MNTLQQKIESLLFYKNEPVSFTWLSKRLGVNEKNIEHELIEMLDFYEDRGITLVISDTKASLLISDVAQEIIQDISKSKEERELSKQALETLTIILYKGPITKAELDYIRGVNSVYILRNLLIRGLIEKQVNTKDKRSPFYVITHDTMSFLGIHKKDELPQFRDFQKKFAQLEQDYKEESLEESIKIK